MKKLLLLVLAAISYPIYAQNDTLTVTDITKGLYNFYPNILEDITPMNDGETYIALNNDNIIKYSFATGQALDTILSNDSYFGYELSPTEDRILYYTNYMPIYRNSFYTNYYIYNIKTKSSEPLYNLARQQQAKFSPDGKKIAFIVNNNILVKDLETNNITTVTIDGKRNAILNGIPDWCYEEEFSFNCAYEFSPDSKKIAYIKFDESNVKEYTLQYYYNQTRKYEANAIYPNNYTYKYPKTGENNSIVSVHIYDFASDKTTTADIGQNTDIYIPKILWTQDPSTLAIVRLNRTQNKLDLLAYNTNTNNTTQIYTMNDKYYIEESVPQSIKFLNDKKSFVIQSEQDGYRHLYRYGLDGKLINAITKGEKEVTQFIGVDEKNKKVYYIGVGNNSTQTALYCADLAGKRITKLSLRDGDNEAVFSKTYKYFINTYSNINTPDIITVNTSNGKEIRTIETNQDVKDKAELYGGINCEIFFWQNKHGDQLSAYIIKPKDFDSTKRYPVLVMGYNGPNYNYVNDTWNFGWQQLLAQKGYIVAATDTRGTGRKGSEFRKCTYGKLGELESEDLANFADYLGSQSFIDGNRLGIWGWSYGGFMAANVMTRFPDKYALGIAVAPVTNWHYYDNIYTERYMGLPTENQNGYLKSSPIYYADNLKGKFLLICGSVDDNVHPQHSLVFAQALVDADKQFEFMQYTNCNHGIYDGNARKHLYTKMTDFIINNL